METLSLDKTRLFIPVLYAVRRAVGQGKRGNAPWEVFHRTYSIAKCACANQFTVGAWKKMASAKFLEEALSTDVDESAVNAIVGSLETQLVTSTPAASGHQAVTAVVSQKNHQLNSAISNGGTIPTAVQKHGVANGGGGILVAARECS